MVKKNIERPRKTTEFVQRKKRTTSVTTKQKTSFLDQRIEEDFEYNKEKKNQFRFFSKVLTFGLHRSQSHLERKRIKLVNFIAAIGLSLQPLFLIMGSMNKMGLLVNLFFITQFITILILQKKNKFNASKFVLLGGGTLMYGLLNLVYGKMIPGDAGFILYVILYIILFQDKKIKIIGMICISFLYVSPLYFLQDYQNMLYQELPVAAYYLQLFIVTFCLFLTINFFLNDLNKYEKHTDELLDSLQESNADLKVKQNIIESQNKDLERFAYVASHDLKAPVRLIGSFVQLIEREIKPYANKKLEEYLKFAKDGTDQINELIKDILDLSKIGTLKIENHKWVALDQTLEKIKLETFSCQKSKNCQITYENLPSIFANPSHMYQLFFNIISNGLKYNISEFPKIRIKYQLQGNYHTFYFQDNGIGIKKENQEKIFEMFTRLQSSSNFKGTGIGLAITRKIANLYEGDLKVLTSSPTGSTFQLSIPIRDGEQFLQEKINLSMGASNS